MTTIVGAGLAGLIAGNMIHGSSIVEAAENVPNNHSAVLRFRSSVVGDTMDVPFRKVNMLKSMLPWRNSIADQLSYSYKCTGTATIRSSITANSILQERWIAPDDLVDILVNRFYKKISFGVVVDYDDMKAPYTEPMISTIPMPSLMKMLKWKEIPDFKYVHGFNINCTLSNVDAYVSLYIPGDKPYNRLSLTGDRMTIEYSFPFMKEEQIQDYGEELQINANAHIDQALEDLGLGWQGIGDLHVQIKKQKYSKILPIDDDIRKRFIMWASDKYGIYSLGRYATWRPGLMLDDLINDVRVIKKLMNGKSQYDYRR